MSVINQMLHDLESRRSQMASSPNFSYQSLSFIPKLSGSNKLETIIYSAIIFTALISVILVFYKFHYIDDKLLIADNMDTQAQQVPMSTSNNNKEQAATYEIATSVIRPEEKIVVKNIAPIKKVTIGKPAQKIILVKTETQSNYGVDGVVHKRQRELPTSQKAENLYQSAYRYVLARNSVKAQEELRNALMIMPGHTKSRELLAGIYIKNGRIVEARTLLQYGIRISPNHTIFAKLYARILMEQNDNVTAISVLLRHPPALTTDADYHALLAALYQKNKQHREAATVYSKLLKLRANNGVWWLGMAISLEALGKNSQAKLAYEKAKTSGNLSKGLIQYTHQRVTALEEIAYP